ncbi:MAG: CarD family transcriptional regulator [Treponema sp.]|jgi:CarD family transcriptional regulator|nr:CarD family transcriptional regulator [Treponema sp.]
MSDIPVYEIDQKIVYPSQGVGKIIDITEKKFKENILKYYVIYLEVSDMTIMVPVEKVADLGIRAIVSEEEALKALDLISEDFEPIPSDWKLRYQMNLDLLKKGTVNDIAAIVRSLYHRSKIKELPILERKLYDSARKLLEDEISFALNKTLKEVEQLIHSKLEPLGVTLDTKRSVSKSHDSDDEDDFIDEENEVEESEEDEEDDDDEEDME